MEKNPYFAALLSIIYPGLGHLYANKYRLAALIIFITTSDLLLIIYQLLTFGYFASHYVVYTTILYWTVIPFAAYRAVNNTKFLEKEGEIGITKEDSFICPNCLHENTKNAEKCINCGKNLNGVLLYSDGRIGRAEYYDVEINRRSIIEYKKDYRGKRNGKFEEYMLNDIKNVEFNDYKIRFFRTNIPFVLSFQYHTGNNQYKTKEMYLNISSLNNLIKTMEVRKIRYSNNLNYT